MSTTKVTPMDVMALTRPTEGFLCPLTANTYDVEFLNFVVSDYETKKTIFEVGKDTPIPVDMAVDLSSLGPDMYRKIKYTFSEDVLRLPQIQTSLFFSVGPKEITGFRMIERHYFRNQLVKSFDFTFGFCIPSSTNNWDTVYDLPPLSESLINEMINNPFETKSDSFYFVNDELIMHNKASYQYVREDASQAKKSYEDKFGSKASSKASPGAKAGAKSSSGTSSSGAEMKAEAKSSSGKAESKTLAKEVEWSKESDYN
jgi:protein unc-119